MLHSNMVNHILRNHLRANRASLKWAVEKSGQESNQQNESLLRQKINIIKVSFIHAIGYSLHNIFGGEQINKRSIQLRQREGILKSTRNRSYNIGDN